MSLGDGQLFIIGHEALAAVSDEEVAATVAALKEVGAYRLPYERVAVRFLTDDVVVGDSKIKSPQYGPWVGKFYRQPDGKWKSNLGPAHWAEMRNVNLLGEPMHFHLVHDGSDPFMRAYDIDTSDDAQIAAALEQTNINTANILITLLATRNALKEVQHNKLAKLGIGGKRPGSTKRYAYVTTIKVPHDLEDDPEHPPQVTHAGIKKKAHLRRGHVRRQRFGPGREFVKMVFINPVFVNADPDYVNTRQAYNVAGGAHAPR